MNIFKTSLLVAVVAVSCSGCSDIRNLIKSDPLIAGGPVIADDTFMLKIQDQSLLPTACRMRYIDDSTGEATRLKDEPSPDANDPPFADELTYTATKDAATTQRDAIKKCTQAMMLLIDVRWGHFADELNATVANGTTVLDITTMGLNIAGGLTAAGTTKVLGAIAAGLTGSKSIINDDMLYKNSIQTILLQMKKDRLKQQQQILARLDSDKKPYNDMFEAALDLYAYDRAGTWNEALLSLQSDVAAKASACQDEVTAAKAAIVAGATPAPATTKGGACSSSGASGTSTASTVTEADLTKNAIFLAKNGDPLKITSNGILPTGTVTYQTFDGKIWVPAESRAERVTLVLGTLAKLVSPGKNDDVPAKGNP